MPSLHIHHRLLSLALSEVDLVPPVIQGCPGNIEVPLDIGTFVMVNWEPPTAIDSQGVAMLIESPALMPGGFFTIGTVPIAYVFSDDAGNTARCDFNITVFQGKMRSPPAPSPHHLILNVPKRRPKHTHYWSTGRKWKRIPIGKENFVK